MDINGPISLSKIYARGNNAEGISLDNALAGGEDVVIKNSTFSMNNTKGLFVYSTGLISLNDVTAIGNTASHGLELDNFNGPKGVNIVKGNLHENGISGVSIETRGPVSINTVTANGNSSHGVYVHGFSSANADVTLSKVNTAWNGNTGIWLQYINNATITLTNSVANGNGGQDADGLYIRGNNIDSSVTISKSVFLGNYGNGIDLYETFIQTIVNTFSFGNDMDGDYTPDQVDTYIHN